MSSRCRASPFLVLVPGWGGTCRIGYPDPHVPFSHQREAKREEILSAVDYVHWINLRPPVPVARAALRLPAHPPRPVGATNTLFFMTRCEGPGVLRLCDAVEAGAGAAAPLSTHGTDHIERQEAHGYPVIRRPWGGAPSPLGR